jgi:hypothetical protein
MDRFGSQAEVMKRLRDVGEVPKGGIDYLPNMPGHVASRQREIGD